MTTLQVLHLALIIVLAFDGGMLFALWRLGSRIEPMLHEWLKEPRDG